MGYRTLKTIFHEHNESKMKDEYTKRFNSLTSFNTNINIIPMGNGKKVNDLEYPLFFMVTKNLSKKQELIVEKLIEHLILYHMQLENNILMIY